MKLVEALVAWTGAPASRGEVLGFILGAVVLVTALAVVVDIITYQGK